jgi:hypothetical protein
VRFSIHISAYYDARFADPQNISCQEKVCRVEMPPKFMETCTYILGMSRPTTAVARATRHDWSSQVCAYGLMPFIGCLGVEPKTNSRQPKVSRF